MPTKRVPTRASTVNEDAVQDRRNDLIASLPFEQIDFRWFSIKNAQHTTCEWLLHNPIYVSWKEGKASSSAHTLIWLKGHPGAGKSTIMKYALAHAEKTKPDDEIILSFFFNARGHGLERNTLGMYRSLMFQLFKEAPDLQCVLDDHRIPSSPGNISWTLRALQTIFLAAAEKLGRRRLRCFIDALDECDEEEIREMVQFFEDLKDTCLGHDRHLYICFASRHYPAIVIHDGQQLILENETGHDEDLMKYIRRHLRAGESRIVDEIRTEIHQKANGVFMWVVLVVQILNAEFRDGRLFKLKQRLREIPEKLSDLFRDILRRDRVNMDEFLLCLQWILFARDPLTPVEFYIAMSVGLDPVGDDQVPEWKSTPWDPTAITAEAMSRFVISSSKGLAMPTKSKNGPTTVQFIHESVQDFLLKDGGLIELWPQPDQGLSRLIASSHDRLKKYCQDYLSVNTSKFATSNRALSEDSGDCEDFIDDVGWWDTVALKDTWRKQFPFLSYASEQVFYHADEAVQVIPQERFLEEFPLFDLIDATYNLTARKRLLHSKKVALLYIFAQMNLARLIKATRPHDLRSRVPGEHYQYPVIAAFLTGHREALMAIVEEDDFVSIEAFMRDPRFGQHKRPDAERDLLGFALDGKNWTLSSQLIASCPDTSLLELLSNQLSRKKYYALLYAVDQGETEIACELLQKVDGVDKKNPGNETLLFEAAKKGELNLANFLLEQERGVTVQEGKLCDALRGAASTKLEGSTEQHGFVQFLLDSGANINAQDRTGCTALFNATGSGQESIVRLLLKNGADVNARGGFHGNPLQVAASLEANMEIVKLLLDSGADVNAQGGVYGNALNTASSHGRVEIVKFLLDRGADVNAQGGEYGNALQAAASNGKIEIVKLLLDRGADVNAQGKHFGNALQAATATFADIEHKEIVVKLLLDNGADVNAQGGKYGNALQAATFKGHKKIRQLLIERGAVSPYQQTKSRMTLISEHDPIPLIPRPGSPLVHEPYRLSHPQPHRRLASSQDAPP